MRQNATVHCIKEAREVLRIFFLKTNVQSSFEIAVNEALANVYKHGQLPVELRMGQIGSRIFVRLKDAGHGFDVKTYSQKIDESILDPFAESGRGIYLMHTCADRLCFNRFGNEVMLVKDLHGVSPEK